jgi:hypothetical protein
MGTLSRATLAWFDPKREMFKKISINGQVEVLAMIGDIEATPRMVAKVEALGSEKTSLNREKPTAPSGVIYLLAKREIERGHTEHEVDRLTS